jgi:predicted transcriptional regulator
MRDDSSDDALRLEETLRMTADIVASYATNNRIDHEQLPDLIRSVYKTMTTLAAGEDVKIQERPKPAVPINKSIQPDYLVCLEDGKRLTMLKRYLRSTYDMTPDEYRKRWGLPSDYPMVAPNYAQKRSEFAKRIGLGRGVRRKDA